MAWEGPHMVWSSLTRRRLLEGAAVAVGGLAAGRAGAQPPVREPTVSRGRTKIVVLGSHGGQQVTVLTGANVRSGTSVLVDVDGALTVVDCGVGSLHRLVEAGYDANRVRNILITHHHQDHNADLGNFAGAGTKAYEQGYKRLARTTIAEQQRGLGLQPDFDRFARWHELSLTRRPRKLITGKRLRVSCARVEHGDIPALGYRIRTPDVDVAFSGDRGPRGDSFASFARGAELLFHEVIERELVESALRAQDTDPGFIRHLVDNHCDPKQVGELASRAGVATLVLYHLIPGNPALSDDSWVAKVRPYFGGRIVVAADLQVI
jgi:ribonuclease BN (tRNA processing enzyme)